MSKVKIFSEYTYDNYYDAIADELNKKIDTWTSENDVDITSVTTNVHTLKNEDERCVIVMTANIIYN